MLSNFLLELKANATDSAGGESKKRSNDKQLSDRVWETPGSLSVQRSSPWMGICLSVPLRACRKKIRQMATIQAMAVCQDPRNRLTGPLKADIRIDVDRSKVDRLRICLTDIRTALR